MICGFGGKLRLNPGLMLAIAISAYGVLAIASSSRAAEGNRAESDAVVAEAEKLVMQAGQADPVDTKMIHQAMDKLHVALKIDPRYDAKGMALNDLQRFGEAEEAWEQALRLNPNLKVAQANLDALNGGPNGRGSVSKHSALVPPQSSPMQ